jgi:hypothetical protein
VKTLKFRVSNKQEHAQPDGTPDVLVSLASQNPNLAPSGLQFAVSPSEEVNWPVGAKVTLELTVE